MALNDLGEEVYERPVSMPVFKKIAPLDTVAERREIAERFTQQRIIRAGRDAWEANRQSGKLRWLESHRRRTGDRPRLCTASIRCKRTHGAAV